MLHCVKRVRIRSYSGPHFFRILFSSNAGKYGKNADQNNSEHGHFFSNVVQIRNTSTHCTITERKEREHSGTFFFCNIRRNKKFLMKVRTFIIVNMHCVKSVRIRSYSGPDRNNSECENFSRSDSLFPN